MPDRLANAAHLKSQLSQVHYPTSGKNHHLLVLMVLVQFSSRIVIYFVSTARITRLVGLNKEEKSRIEYNSERPHSALNYQTPDEFINQIEQQRISAA